MAGEGDAWRAGPSRTGARSELALLHDRVAPPCGPCLTPLLPATAAVDKCASGGLYKAPLAGARITAINSTTFEWDNSCLPGVDKIDIYMYAPYSESSNLPIHAFVGIPASRGSYDVSLEPRWWNSTENVNLSLNIVSSGNEPWDSKNPTGPIWSSQYIKPADGSTPKEAQLGGPTSLKSELISVFYAEGSLTKSGLTAAIVCPIILLLCGLAVWIRKLHINRNNKHADWAEHMDKRMSRVSLDWTSGGDGRAGPTPGSRPASFMRPQSTFTRPSLAGGRPSLGGADYHGDNMAGRGAGVYGGMEEPEMAEVNPADFRRPSPLGGAARENRDSRTQSRISFAQSTAGDRVSKISYGPSSEGHSAVRNGGHRPSGSIPRVGGSRRSNYDSYYDPDAPELPKLSNSKWQQQHGRNSPYAQGATEDAVEDIDDSADLTAMSPTQNQGPQPIGNVDVHSMRESIDAQRALGSGSPTRPRVLTPNGDDDADRDFRNSVLKYPALSMVTGGVGREESDGTDMFAALNAGRPISGLSDGGDSAYAPEQGRSAEYIDHAHYATTAGAHAIAPEHPARRAAAAVNSNTGMAPARNVTSPDDALRQYAALRAAPSTGGNGGMRTLYTPDPAPNFAHRGSAHTAGSSINEDDVVGYNDMETFNKH
ncbi:hypothetical protein FA09DRAFT_302531 [Tilletiopsis washingtonensis]|uniref:Uncharacterized protein n=1 Tax=Tilletiopsis washingtonensis TaxID=58919 RepID=A0A316YZ67_9BASI|nr:hypothetical protein FA09DRAFT_302531 [Tilletiopsis washingtonensis]PWN94750.1 hypothetical protein FA09DRAFT_302531 [Tilletiopsis washingtonensis]